MVDGWREVHGIKRGLIGASYTSGPKETDVVYNLHVNDANLLNVGVVSR